MKSSVTNPGPFTNRGDPLTWRLAQTRVANDLRYFNEAKMCLMMQRHLQIYPTEEKTTANASVAKISKRFSLFKQSSNSLLEGHTWEWLQSIWRNPFGSTLSSRLNR